jgi:hypothetical protein
MYLIAFPLLLVPFVLYNMVAFLFDLPFGTVLFSFSLLSGGSLAINIGDALVILGALLLYLEILKATRLAGKAVMDHLLSVMLLAAMVFELVSAQRAATSTFLVLLVLSFVDVISGLSLAVPDTPRNIALETPDQMSAAS